MNVYKIVDAAKRGNLTVLFTYNAEGTRAPPMLLFSYKGSIPRNVLENCPSGWGIGNLDTG